MKRIYICSDCLSVTVDGEESFTNEVVNPDNCNMCGSHRVHIFLAVEVANEAEASFLEAVFGDAKITLDKGGLPMSRIVIKE